MLNKTFGPKKGKEIKQNLTRPENIDICACLSFEHNCQSFTS